MANIIMQGRSKVGEVLSTINDFTSIKEVNTALTSEANKLWRAKILLDRVTRLGGKDNPSKVKPNSEIVPKLESPSKGQTYKPLRKGRLSPINDQYRTAQIDFSYETDPFKSSPEGTSTLIKSRSELRSKSKEDNSIIIYNFLVSPVQYIILQTVPQEVEFQGESQWAVINSMGRNTPMYHFTGSESVIQMNISWYCNDKSNPEEVVAKCRLLEAWTKANGYGAAPPILKIKWGRSELFENQYFILAAATYKLSNWKSDVKTWDKQSNSFKRPEGYADPALYPSMATQELIFKRVSSTNLTYEDIIPQKWIDKTRGINKT